MNIIDHDGGEPISKPGVYRMDAAHYHADPVIKPSLSSSIAKIIIEQTPRHAAAEHPRLPGAKKERKESSAMSLGSVVHEMILGKGGGFDVFDFADWRTKAAQAAREASIASGHAAILKADFERAKLIEAELRGILMEIPRCQNFFAPGHGDAETVLIWQEPNGVWCRAMFDWWMNDRAHVVDLKTTGLGADPVAAGKTTANMGYEVSQAFYLRGLTRLFPELAGKERFSFVFAEVEAPYEVSVIELDATAKELGRRKVEYAVSRFGDCQRDGEWPGYPRKVQTAEYPVWAEKAWMERELNDPYFV
jgi:hypothetical protein